MKNKENFALYSGWHQEIDETISKSNSLCFALFSTDGELIFSNDAFNLLIKNDPIESFINPTFDKLLEMKSSSNLIFDGFLTLGNHDSKDTSIVAQVYRKQNKLMVIGGIDTLQMLRQNNQLIDLNREINNLQRELLKKTYSLENTLEELNAANMELKNEKTTRDKLYTVIAHDLRSPFNSILGFTDSLIENIENIDRQKARKFLGIINSSAQKTLWLLDNLLNWAKSQTGQISFNPKKVDLSSIIREIIDDFLPSANIKNIMLTYQSSADCDVFIDPNMFKTIFRNLISNAIKFTPTDGRISISAIPKNDIVEIAVSDNGIGMDEETRKKLFNLDENLTKQGTEGEKGSGLGLLLCKEFVEKHGGKIWVESVPGRGTTFYVQLKYMGFTSSANTTEAKTAEISASKSHLVLIAEDDDTSFEYLKTVLARQGLSLLRAKTGKDAIKACQENPEINLVLMDMQMPEMNGYEATREILKFRPGLPTIAQTAFAFPTDKDEALKSGCVDYISKPISKDNLLAILNKYLK